MRVPFSSTCESVVKPVPVTVTGVGELPLGTLDGLSDEATGTGLLAGVGPRWTVVATEGTPLLRMNSM